MLIDIYIVISMVTLHIHAESPTANRLIRMNGFECLSLSSNVADAVSCCLAGEVGDSMDNEVASAACN